MKRRYRLLIGFIITGIILILIFIITKDRKIYYLSLGDFLAVGETSDSNNIYSYGDYIKDYLKDKELLEFYTKDFAKSEYRSIDILNDLINNKEIKQGKNIITLKNALIKADIVTVSVGMNDLLYKINLATELIQEDTNSIYTYIDEVIIDIDRLLYELRKSCKEQIIVLGFYNPFNNTSLISSSMEQVINYANSNLENIVRKYDMTFVNLHDSFLANNNYLSDSPQIKPTKEGYIGIYKNIIKAIDKKILEK